MATERAKSAAARAANRRPRVPPTDPPPPVTPPPATKKDEQLAADLAGTYTLVGMMVSVADPTLGTSIVVNGPEAARAWVELGARNPKVRASLESLTRASVWGAVISVHLRMMTPILPGFQRTEEESPEPERVFVAPPAAADTTNGHVPDYGVSTPAPAPVSWFTSKAGIPSPADLGVQVANPDTFPFPTDSSPPNGTDS